MQTKSCGRIFCAVLGMYLQWYIELYFTGRWSDHKSDLGIFLVYQTTRSVDVCSATSGTRFESWYLTSVCGCCMAGVKQLQWERSRDRDVSNRQRRRPKHGNVNRRAVKQCQHSAAARNNIGRTRRRTKQRWWWWLWCVCNREIVAVVTTVMRCWWRLVEEATTQGDII